MKKTIIAVVPLSILGAVIIGFTNCGGTGGHGSGFGNQFVNTSCSPDSSCLDVGTPGGAIPVASDARYSAELRNGDGSPSAGIEICCGCPDGGCSIVDPSGGCALTDSSGFLSGTFRCADPGSHQFECRAPSGFGLVTRNTIRCADSGITVCESNADCGSNQFCAEPDGSCGFSEPSSCMPLGTTSSGCCEANSQCSEGLECSSPGTASCSEPASCGNGIVESGEACDDGDFDDFDGCTSGCAVGPVCGNGLLEAGEGCDDSNRTPGDGCSANCQTEAP